MKVILVLTCVMERVEIRTGEVITTNVPFRSKTGIIIEEDDVNEFYKNYCKKLSSLKRLLRTTSATRKSKTANITKR